MSIFMTKLLHKIEPTDNSLARHLVFKKMAQNVLPEDGTYIPSHTEETHLTYVLIRYCVLVGIIKKMYSPSF
jgi:hypothetical protein